MSRPAHPKLADMIGVEINGCLVLSRAIENSADGSARWNVRASCGHDAIVAGKNLRTREDIGAPLYRCASCRPNKRGRKPAPALETSNG